MSDKLKRLKKLKSSEVQIDYKYVKLDGLPELLEELRGIAISAEESKQEFASIVKEFTKTITKNKSTGDTKSIISAIKGLSLKVMPAENVNTDYKIDFDRDRNGLMKTGITFTSIKRRTH